MDLEEYILDNEHNKTNLKDLITTFDKDLFVPFVGAGPSTTLGEPNWDKLLTDICASFNVRNFKRVKLNDGNIDYPKTFSRLFKRVSDKKQFYDKLFKLIEPTETSATWFHRTLVKTFDSYITTNYDSPIEKAFNDSNKRTLKKQYFSCYGLKNMDDCIVYLHGHKDINFCIIKSEDYDYFYPSIADNSGGIPILEDFLTDIFTQRSIIFVGFSFDDKYIGNFLKYLTPTNQRYTHYWLLSESIDPYKSIEQKSKELIQRGKKNKAEFEMSKFYNGQFNIKPIVYKQNYHIFSERLFERLSESQPVNINPGVISSMPVR